MGTGEVGSLSSAIWICWIEIRAQNPWLSSLLVITKASLPGKKKEEKGISQSIYIYICDCTNHSNYLMLTYQDEGSHGVGSYILWSHPGIWVYILFPHLVTQQYHNNWYIYSTPFLDFVTLIYTPIRSHSLQSALLFSTLTLHTLYSSSCSVCLLVGMYLKFIA